MKKIILLVVLIITSCSKDNQNESKNNLEDGEDSTIDVDGKNTHSLSSSDLDEYSEGAGSLAEQDIPTTSETNLSSRKPTRRMKFVYKSS